MLFHEWRNLKNKKKKGKKTFECWTKFENKAISHNFQDVCAAFRALGLCAGI